jgi:predicted nuclease of restriction endonuclease-like (RecB) superfamily
MEGQFSEIIALIKQSQANALRTVNAELINLHWNIGAYISGRLSNAEWGDKTIKELAVYIQRNNPELKGFSRTGLYRMTQFFDIYSQSLIVPSVMGQLQDIKETLLARISWTQHTLIFSRCKSQEEREFYIRQSLQEHYSVRELDRQITASLFERTMLGRAATAAIQEKRPDISEVFKDSYIFDFLNLPEQYNENDLQKGLIRQMKHFILELGRDFLFIGEEYKLQVGNSDFYIDLLFYHRGLQCLVAFELKADKFRPEQLGQLNFYLEALDRDVKKEHENPSIGILLCKDQDIEVVEYSLSRSLSPTMVAQYRTQLPDKAMLQQKLQELFHSKRGQ